MSDDEANKRKRVNFGFPGGSVNGFEDVVKTAKSYSSNKQTRTSLDA